MKDDIAKLRSEVATLRRLFLSKVDIVESKLNALEEELGGEPELTIDDDRESQVQATPEVAKNPVLSEHQQNIQSNKAVFTVSEPRVAAQEPDSPASKTRQQAQRPQQQQQKPSSISLLFFWFVNLVMEQWRLGAIVERGLDTYRDYQRQGKAPLFLLTASGIVILLIGLGFLLQFTFDQFTPLMKVGSGYLLTAAVFATGLYLRRSNEQWGSFSSAIIGLSLLIGYLTSYFIGPYFGLVSSGAAFFIFSAITLLGYLLCHFFEARILAYLSLIGGVFLPWIAGAPQALSLTFTAYLFVLNVASLLIAKRHDLRSLTYLTIVLTSASIEYQLVTSAANHWGFVALLHGFFFLYAGFIYSSVKHQLTGKVLTLFSTNLLFYTFVSWQWFDSFTQQSPNNIYFLMAGVASLVALITLLKRRSFEFTLSVMHAGVFCAFAAVAWLGVSGAGIIWAIEAVLLFALGLVFRQKMLRTEAYLVLIISILINLWAIIEWFAATSSASSYFALIYLFALGLSAQCIISFPGLIKKPWPQGESLAVYLLREWVSFWLAASVIAICYLYFPIAFMVSPLIPMFLLIWRHGKYQLPFSQAVAVLAFFFSAGLILQDIIELGSFHFSDWPLVIKLSAAAAFGCLFLLPKYYEKRLPQGNLLGFMGVLKLIFWLLLPIIYLPSALRRVPDWFPLICWFSVSFSSVIYWRVKQTILGIEMIALTWVAIIATLIGWLVQQSNDAFNAAQIALFFALTYFGVILYWRKSYQRTGRTRIQVTPLFNWQASGSYYFASLAVALTTYWLSKNVAIMLLTAFALHLSVVVYWPALKAMRYQRIKHLAHHLRLGWMLVLTLLLFSQVRNSIFDLSLALLSVILLGLVLHGKRHYQKLITQLGKTNKITYWSYQLTLILAYSFVLEYVTGNYFGPALSVALILHSIALFFLAQKPLFHSFEKLALGMFGLSLLKIFLHDMSDFSLIEKVISFIVIGILLLIAAFQYQRLKSKDAIRH
ncbi:DUF2339 domain-containing protein [Pleionea mediterranea]|uniref:Putative membrane protein n=1 Tax=Pleionea mediterranea TaxID=523701 RepID=A0A316G053_9GAMM|nr:DUF2339 domain-containing protein [Pleionea mediterranea]PWK54334.1 putative membrane protein [Pleionea mediterranea]